MKLSVGCGVRVAALVLLSLALLGAKRPGNLGDVVEVRYWSYPDYTRVVVELTRPISSQVRHLPANAKAQRPERLYLDLDGVWVGRRFADGITVGDGLLEGVRLGQNTLTRTRLVIDVEHYERHRLFTLTSPHRLVVDVYGPRDGGESLTWPEAGDRRNREPSRLPMEMRPVQTVVLDAGHGGRDPGAIGVGGVREKDVTLSLAKALKPRLEKRGFKVVLTRSGDRSVSLEERTAIAEAARGDLFVSLHANASRRRSLRGVETYYLDEDYARHSLTLAARENGIETADVDDLQRTVARFRVSETSTHSRRLAHLVHGEIVEGLKRQRRPVKDLGVKKGPFYVLFLSDTPAILVEAGFLTNRAAAKRLADRKYLEAVADEIANGLNRYRESRSQVAARVTP